MECQSDTDFSKGENLGSRVEHGDFPEAAYIMALTT
jgi:hypothetical protein